jgi:hypothetical protein
VTEKTIPEQAGSLYALCDEAIVVKPNGDQWDVFDGPGGSYVDTVDTAVLIEVDDHYDMPVQLVDGADWRTLYAT